MVVGLVSMPMPMPMPKSMSRIISGFKIREGKVL